MIPPTLGSDPRGYTVSLGLQEVEPEGEGCESVINIGLFFDGTGHNLFRDEATNSHSNVARLYLAYRNAPRENYYSYYMPGIGTSFPQIAEDENTAKTMCRGDLGWGGDGRILYALIQVFNSVRQSFRNAEKNLDMRSDYFSDAMTKVICKSGELTADQTGAAAVAIESGWDIDRSNFNARLKTIRDQAGPLTQLIRHPRTLPKPISLMIDVFGFCRGAAAARVFANKLFGMCSGSELFGVPMQLRFLGLFDTVASADLPNSARGDGHHAWAPVEDLKIDARIRNWQHAVALHEARASFPLDSAREDGVDLRNGFEIVYPGTHGDIGGGHQPGEQGRGMISNDQGSWGCDDRSKFSQVPLNDMFNNAIEAGVPWIRFDSEMGAKLRLARIFGINDRLPDSMRNYFLRCGVASGSSVEEMILRHRMLYLVWRYQIRHAFAKQPGTERAMANGKRFSGKADLLDGNKVLIAQIKRLESIGDIRQALINHFDAIWAPTSKQILVDIKKISGTSVAAAVREFFDQHMHDSYACFQSNDWLSGLESQEYLHHRVVWVGNRKALSTTTSEPAPVNDSPAPPPRYVHGDFKPSRWWEMKTRVRNFISDRYSSK